MIKTLVHTALAALLAFAGATGASAAAYDAGDYNKVWDFSADGWAAGSEKDGLTLGSTKVTLDPTGGNLPVGDATATEKLKGRLKLGGSIGAEVCCHFQIAGDVDITLFGTSGKAATTRQLTIKAGDTYATATALKTDFVPGDGNSIQHDTYHYVGGPTTIYIGSSNSGYNIYRIGLNYKDHFWNFSDDGWAVGATKDGLTLGGNMTISDNNKTIDDHSFTKRVQTGGAITSTTRYFSFVVSPGAVVTVYGMSGSNGKERQLCVSSTASTAGDLAASLNVNDGAAISKDSWTYTGTTDQTIYIGSTSGGYNLYAIAVAYGGPKGPAFSTQPQSVKTAVLGTTYTLTAAATGATAYQWYECTNAAGEGATAIAGATATTLAVTPSAIGDRYFMCQATDGTTTANSAVATVSTQVRFTTDLLPAEHATVRRPFTLTVAADNATSYQWYEGGNPLPGETATTLTITDRHQGTRTFHAVATNGANSKASTACAVTITNNLYQDQLWDAQHQRAQYLAAGVMTQADITAFNQQKVRGQQYGLDVLADATTVLAHGGTVDASGNSKGKLAYNDGRLQFNTGTVVRVPVIAAGDVVTTTLQAGTVSLGGTTATGKDATATHTATAAEAAQGYVELIANAESYLYTITSSNLTPLYNDVSFIGRGATFSQPAGNYPQGATIAAVATPDYGRYLATLTVAGQTVALPADPQQARRPFAFDIFVDGDIEVQYTTASLDVQPAPLVTALPAAGGSVSRTPEADKYVVGDTIVLHAEANPGYTFQHWTDGKGTALPGDATTPDYRYVMTADAAVIVANFTRPATTYTATFAQPVDAATGNTITGLDGTLPKPQTGYYVVLPRNVAFAHKSYYLQAWRIAGKDYTPGTLLNLTADVQITPVLAHVAAGGTDATLRNRDDVMTLRWNFGTELGALPMNVAAGTHFIYTAPAAGTYTIAAGTTPQHSVLDIPMPVSTGTGDILNNDPDYSMPGWCAIGQGVTMQVPAFHGSTVSLYTYGPITTTTLDGLPPTREQRTDDGYLYSWQLGQTSHIIDEVNTPGVFSLPLVIGDDYSYYKYLEIELQPIVVSKERLLLNTDFNEADAAQQWPHIVAPDNTTGSNTAATRPVRTTDYSGEHITFAITSADLLPATKFKVQEKFQEAPGFIRACKANGGNGSGTTQDDYYDPVFRTYKENATVTTSQFKNVTRVIFQQGATGTKRGWALEVSHDGLSWHSLMPADYVGVATSNVVEEREIVLPEADQKDVYLRWSNISTGNYAMLFGFKVYGTATTSVEQINLRTSVSNAAQGAIVLSPEGSRPSADPDLFAYDKGDVVTITAKANFGFEFDHFEDADGNRITQDVAGTVLTRTMTQHGTVHAVFHEKKTYFVVFSQGTEASGTAPSSLELEYDDATFTVPQNQTLYLAGYTLDHWEDSDANRYAIGTRYNIGDNDVAGVTRYRKGDVRLRPVFRKNTKTLADITDPTTVAWQFGQTYAQPLMFQSVAGLYVAPVTIGGETIDFAVTLDATGDKAKFDNTGNLKNPRMSDAQVNANTRLIFPITQGATLTLTTSSDVLRLTEILGATSTAASDAAPKYATGKTITLTYGGTHDEADIRVLDEKVYVASLAITYVPLDDAQRPALTAVTIGDHTLTRAELNKVIAGTYTHTFVANSDQAPYPTVTAEVSVGDITVTQPAAVNNYTAQLVIKNYATYNIPFTRAYQGYQALLFQGSSINDGDTGVPATTALVLHFNNTMAAATATLTRGSNTWTVSAPEGQDLAFPLWDLQLNSSYTLTIPAGQLTDVYGQHYNHPVDISFATGNTTVKVTKKAFDFVVGPDGDLNKAIASANAAGGTGRYYIFVPDGQYLMPGNAMITVNGNETADSTGTMRPDLNGVEFNNGLTALSRNAVSLIGQSRDGVTIYNRPLVEGISYTATLRLDPTSKDFYAQDLTLENRFPYFKVHSADGTTTGTGRAVAFQDKGARTILKNVALLSYQDTYYSNPASQPEYRAYFEDTRLAGVVDFLCGGGDLWLERCHIMLRNRENNNIAAPSTGNNCRYGYVFSNCTVSPEPGATLVANKGFTLARPWAATMAPGVTVSPACTFLRTEFAVTPKGTGWQKMGGNTVIRFHEYGSTHLQASLSLAERTISQCGPLPGSDMCVLTEQGAADYTLRNVLAGNDAYNPQVYTRQRPAPVVSQDDATISWDDDPEALCYFLFKDGEYCDNFIEPHYTLTQTGNYTIRVANARGGLGPESEPIYFKPRAAVNIDITDIGFATVYLDFNARIPAGVTAYAAVRADKTKLYMTRLDPADCLAANHGYVLKGPQGTYTFTFTSHNASDDSKASILSGSTTSRPANNIACYTLAAPGGVDNIGFYDFTGAFLSTNRAYLDKKYVQGDGVLVPDQSGARRGVICSFDELLHPTGIGTLRNADTHNNKNTYNLQGQPDNTNAKGRTYITRGRKWTR